MNSEAEYVSMTGRSLLGYGYKFKNFNVPKKLLNGSTIFFTDSEYLYFMETDEETEN